MDKRTEKLLTESVKRILEHADMNLMTESKVRKLAAEDTGLDLNVSSNRKVVKRIIEDFFAQNADEESDVAAESGGEQGDEEEEEEVQAKGQQSKPRGKERKRVIIDEDSDVSEDKPSSKTRTIEASAGIGREGGRSRKATGKQRVAESEEEDEEEEEEEEEENSSEEEAPAKKKGKSAFKKNDNGDLVVCQLGPKRTVTVGDYQGKTYVSIREYYEKDGKRLPSAKGISLTAEQWEAFREGVPDIQAAIKRIQRT